TSFPPRPFRSMRTTALAGGLGCSGLALNILANGLLKGSSDMSVPDGRVETIGAVEVRQQLQCTRPAEFGGSGVERGGHLLVLRAVDGAGDVDDALAGAPGSRLEQLALLRERPQLDAPARVGAAAERADLGAGRIDEHAVGRARFADDLDRAGAG